MFGVQERIAAFKSILGEYPQAKGNELLWPCRFCQQEGKDSHGDNFSFNIVKNTWNCIAVKDHGRQMSGLLRSVPEQSNPSFKTRKMKSAEYIPPSEMPQEILDYWEDRKITLKAFEHFKVKYDKANISMDFPTNTFQDKKKVLFHEEKNRSNYKQKKIGNNTVYPVNNKYEGQKKFIYLEGEPDLWCMYSNFPESFFKEYYVATTLHGAAHIPVLWKDPKYWENYTNVYLIGDDDIAGKNAVNKLKELIGNKAKIINLDFKHQRTINGIEIFHTSKDFNDWIIEGGTYEQFLNILNNNSSNNTDIDKAAISYLNNPNLLEEYLNDMRKLGIVGEEENLVRIYLCCISYKLEKCLGLILKGATSSGKTTLLKAVSQLMPENIVHPVTSQSAQALNYWTDISHQIIIITEERPPEDTFWEVMSSWRQLIEDNEITRIIIDNNEKDINKKRKEVKVRGPIVYLSSTTQPKLNEENENRLFIFHTDDTPEHTKAIIEYTIHNDDELSSQKRDFIIKKHQRAIELLEPYLYRDIVIPFQKQITFNAYGPEAGRDIKKLLKIIKVCTYLHQYQREQKNEKVALGESPSSAVIPVNSQELEKVVNPSATSATQVPQGRWHLDNGEISANSGKFNEIESKCHKKPKESATLKQIKSSVKDYEVIYKYFFSYFEASSSRLSQALKDKWHVIYKYTGDNQSFTYKDCMNQWNVSRAGAQKIINQMTEQEMVVKISKEEGDLYNGTRGKEAQYRCIAWNLKGSGMKQVLGEQIELNNTPEALKEPVADKLPIIKTEEEDF